MNVLRILMYIDRIHERKKTKTFVQNFNNKVSADKKEVGYLNSQKIRKIVRILLNNICISNES